MTEKLTIEIAISESLLEDKVPSVAALVASEAYRSAYEATIKKMFNE